MGNQLAGAAPAHIVPLEHLLADHPYLQLENSLGSTRFLKVALVKWRNTERRLVAKVFAIQDPSLPLAEHRDRALKVKETLRHVPNCLPFARATLTDRSAFLLREYARTSLYDRVCTRPFLTHIEKKWLTFQLLYALHRAHKLNQCHGDIKLENVMVTSWSWVLLTDWASFKPTYLPHDNPADFNYFFDTSRRRVCYVAPERFVSTGEQGSLPQEQKAELKPHMDIFSAGCALIELWNDGRPALDLPGLLALRAGEPRPASLQPNPAGPVEMLLSMTERDPALRKTAETYLDQERGKFFPEYFYSFLHPYMTLFSTQPSMSADEKMCRLAADVASICRLLTGGTGATVDGGTSSGAVDGGTRSGTVDRETRSRSVDEGSSCGTVVDGATVDGGTRSGTVDKETDPGRVDSETNAGETSGTVDGGIGRETDVRGTRGRTVAKGAGPEGVEGLAMVAALCASCVRGLKHAASRRAAVAVFLALAEHARPETLLDRILPYLVQLTTDSEGRVRAAAVRAVAAAVSRLPRAPPSDAALFPEYLLPELAARARDPHRLVRLALAQSLPSLASTAMRFLEAHALEDGAGGAVQLEAERAVIQELVRTPLTALLTDPSPVVKRALLHDPTALPQLCVFFGKQKANDVIVSHLVTFLNDKEECLVRGWFWSGCVAVWCCSGGAPHAALLSPLVGGALSERCEWALCRALGAGASLARLRLLPARHLHTLLADAAPYLAHPNRWIRVEVLGLVSACWGAAGALHAACKLRPLLAPQCARAPALPQRPELLAASLAPPLPRALLTALATHPHADRLIHALRHRREQRARNKYEPLEPDLAAAFRKLHAHGLTERAEAQLLALSAHVLKWRGSSSGPHAPYNSACCSGNRTHGGRIQIRGVQSRRVYVGASAAAPQHAPAPPLNTEWHHMFAQPPPRAATPPQGSAPPEPVADVPPPAAPDAETESGDAREASARGAAGRGREAGEVAASGGAARCRRELALLTARARSQRGRRTAHTLDECGWEGAGAREGPEGRALRLRAALQDVRARITRLQPLRPRLLAAAAADGTVRLWHWDGGRSRATYNRGAGAGGVVSLASCERGASLAAAAPHSVFVLRLPLMSSTSRLALSQSRALPREEGGAQDVAGARWSPDVLAYCTLYGGAVGWDLRAPQDAFRLAHEPRLGAPTALLAPAAPYLAVGTATGAIRIWDLRFLVPLATLGSTNGTERIRRLAAGEGGARSSSALWSLCGNEVSRWCVEAGQRTHVLRAHNLHHLTGLEAFMESEGEAVVAGGHDLRVRYWSVAPGAWERSRALVDPHEVPLRVRSSLQDGCAVLQEVGGQSAGPSTGAGPDSPYRWAERGPAAGPHCAPLTDLCLAPRDQGWKLATAAADGLVCLWD